MEYTLTCTPCLPLLVVQTHFTPRFEPSFHNKDGQTVNAANGLWLNCFYFPGFFSSLSQPIKQE